jgi:hypothetical protein
LASLAVSGGVAVCQSNETVPVPQVEPSWFESLRDLPVLRWLSGMSPFLAPPPDAALVPAPPPPCPVQPLAAVDDADALLMENDTDGPSSLNIDGLTPRTSHALSRFENLVAARGGTFTLRSAYRPAAYQGHLRDVWLKWVGELRSNTDPACADLRQQVGGEFTRHRLLATQSPVEVSDHTLGIGFDAAIVLPSRRRGRRGPGTLDALARLSGVLRPDIRRDPVHFRLIGARG